MTGSTLAYKRGAREPFLQRANKHSALCLSGPTGPNSVHTWMPIPSIDEMAATDVSQEALPCIILAKTESGETVEVARATMCYFAQQPGLLKPVLMLRLLRPKIVERYPDGPEFDYMEPMEDREGEPFII